MNLIERHLAPSDIRKPDRPGRSVARIHRSSLAFDPALVPGEGRWKEYAEMRVDRGTRLCFTSVGVRLVSWTRRPISFEPLVGRMGTRAKNDLMNRDDHSRTVEAVADSQKRTAPHRSDVLLIGHGRAHSRGSSSSPRS